jgi:lactoylglutathione lyase
VEKTIKFYQDAFQLKQLFLHESKQYGELDTGNTKLAFASEALSESNGVGFVKNTSNKLAAGFEIALVCEDVYGVYQVACKAGAVSVREPYKKPWGQMVAFVRNINGVLIELCTPLG